MVKVLFISVKVTKNCQCNKYHHTLKLEVIFIILKIFTMLIVFRAFHVSSILAYVSN
jgi:hypothetical protein